MAQSGDPEVVKNFDTLRLGLREQGWIEGQNIALEERWADLKYERLPALATQLVQLRVDAVVGATTPLIDAARKVTQTIPIIMVGILDPVGSGFISSFARPGGNITGLSAFRAQRSSASKWSSSTRWSRP